MIFQESETVELKSMVVDDPDGTALQISNMVRDAIKPDLTMFFHYETLNEDGKQIVAIDIQQGTERPYYVAKKGLCPEGVQGTFTRKDVE